MISKLNAVSVTLDNPSVGKRNSTVLENRTLNYTHTHIQYTPHSLAHTQERPHILLMSISSSCHAYQLPHLGINNGWYSNKNTVLD